MRLFSNARAMFGLALLGCGVLLAVALYLQYGLGQQPCPLCYVQRLEVMLFALICLLATLHNPAHKGRKVYAWLLLLTALAGIATAGRQIWLQHLPKDQLPACLPPLDFMLEALPLQEVIMKMLHGSSDCAEIGWTFLGLNIAQMSMISFLGMLVWSLILLLRRFPCDTIFK